MVQFCCLALCTILLSHGSSHCFVLEVCPALLSFFLSYFLCLVRWHLRLCFVLGVFCHLSAWVTASERLLLLWCQVRAEEREEEEEESKDERRGGRKKTSTAERSSIIFVPPLPSPSSPSGCIALDEAVRILSCRSRLQHQSARYGGKMMAVNIGYEEGQKLVAKYQPLVPPGEGHGLCIRFVGR